MSGKTLPMVGGVRTCAAQAVRVVRHGCRCFSFSVQVPGPNSPLLRFTSSTEIGRPLFSYVPPLRSGGPFRPLTTLEALTEQHVLRSASSSLEVTLSSGNPAANTHSGGRLLGD